MRRNSILKYATLSEMNTKRSLRLLRRPIVTDGKVKLQSLKDILKEHWEENYSHLHQGNENSSEKLIMNASTSDGGVPTCKFCGKKGYLECWKKHGKPEKEKYLRKCWLCGSTEHNKKMGATEMR